MKFLNLMRNISEKKNKAKITFAFLLGAFTWKLF